MPMKTPARPPRPTGARSPVRRVAARLALVAGALVVALALAGAWVWRSAGTDTVGQVRFERALRIPPLAEPRVARDGRKVFDLRLQTGRSELLPGTRTSTWGVNGAYLGPTVRASRGDRVTMNVTNKVGATTTLHWHGMHLPAKADGGPHQPVAPGRTWKPSWRIDQPAATLWYHPHLHGSTADHVYRGLSGLFLLDDPEAGVLSLPQRYGADDIPLIVQDKRFRDDGELDESDPASSAIGRLGDHLLVNGTSGPYLDVRHRRIRFRLLNASNARTYDFRFDDRRGFALIGTDGGLLNRPHRTDHVQLSPGERAEIVVAFEPGERVTLRSEGPDLGTNPVQSRFNGGDDRFDVLELRASDRLADAPDVPTRLAEPAPLREADATRTRRFELTGSTRIDGRRMDLSRIDATIQADTTELWEVRNASGTPHNFHVHDVRFTVVGYAGSPPPPPLVGWKDTVYVPPGKTVRLVTQFTAYTDRSTPYMFHCHFLRHEDRGMMGQFVVVRRGERAARPRVPGPAHGHP